MHASLTGLAAFGTLVQLLPGASAHGFVNLIKTGGKFYPGWDLNYYYQTNPPAVAGWSTTALDSGFVSPQINRRQIVIHQSHRKLTTTTPGHPRHLRLPRHHLPQIRQTRQSAHPRRRRPVRPALLEHLAARPQRPRPRLPGPLRQQRLLDRRQDGPQIRQNRPGRLAQRARAGELGGQ